MLSIEKIVQHNLDSYNNRDIENFMLTFDDNIEMYLFSKDEPIATGKAAVRKLYGEVFTASPDLHSTIINRIVIDNKVIDHESIKGRIGSDETLEMVLIYEVINGKIIKITAIKNDN